MYVRAGDVRAAAGCVQTGHSVPIWRSAAAVVARRRNGIRGRRFASCSVGRFLGTRGRARPARVATWPRGGGSRGARPRCGNCPAGRHASCSVRPVPCAPGNLHRHHDLRRVRPSHWQQTRGAHGRAFARPGAGGRWRWRWRGACAARRPRHRVRAAPARGGSRHSPRHVAWARPRAPLARCTRRVPRRGAAGPGHVGVARAGRAEAQLLGRVLERGVTCGRAPRALRRARCARCVDSVRGPGGAGARRGVQDVDARAPARCAREHCTRVRQTSRRGRIV